MFQIWKLQYNLTLKHQDFLKKTEKSVGFQYNILNQSYSVSEFFLKYNWCKNFKQMLKIYLKKINKIKIF
jgi:hypothetical protein